MSKEVKRKFGIRDSLAYAAGDLGCNISYAFLLIAVQIWDAVNDPLIGTMIDADRHHYKRNKFLSYIIVGSVEHETNRKSE